MVLRDWMHGGCDGDDDVNLNFNNKITIFFWENSDISWVKNEPLSDWLEQHFEEHPEWFECWIEAFRCAWTVSEFSSSATGGRQNAEMAFKSFCSLSTFITSTTSSSESPIESFPESLNFASSKNKLTIHNLWLVIISGW